MKEVLIGEVGVDSGQLLLCDPCYIDSQWKKEDFQDVRKYKHKTTGEVLQYRVDFANYESPIKKHGDKTMNQLNSTGEWEKLENADLAEHPFSYNACCQATLSEKRHGQLNYKMGHSGVGVAFSTAFGDGVYPVYAKYNKEGLVSVTVKFQ